MLTSTTLVPLAFILGAQTFTKVINNLIKKDQKGLGVFMDVLFRSCKV